MSTQYFNFNHEADLTPVEVNDVTGEVTLTLEDQTQTFNDKQEFAEFYATARNVLPENLKNWVLTEDQNQFAFVLRSGTAGLDVDKTAKLVEAYRAAGMTPQEIGAAIASQVAQSNTDAEPSQDALSFDTVDEVVDAVKGTVNGMSLTDKRLAKRALRSVGLTNEDTSSVDDEELVNAFTTENFRDLYETLADEDEMEDLLNEAEETEYFDADEYSFDNELAYVYDDLDIDEEDDPEYSTSVAVVAVISKAVSEGRDILENLYPVPAEIGLDLELGHSLQTLEESNANETSFKKAQFQAKLAHRQKFATVVKPVYEYNGEYSVDEYSGDYDANAVMGAEPDFGDVIYVVAGRYYLVSFE